MLVAHVLQRNVNVSTIHVLVGYWRQGWTFCSSGLHGWSCLVCSSQANCHSRLCSYTQWSGTSTAERCVRVHKYLCMCMCVYTQRYIYTNVHACMYTIYMCACLSTLRSPLCVYAHSMLSLVCIAQCSHEHVYHDRLSCTSEVHLCPGLGTG